MRLNINDTELLPALHKGEAVAFETIYAHFVRPLRFFIGRFVKDSAAAEDIAVESFTRTFRKHADFQTIDNLKSYLYTTASRAAIDHFRLQKKQQEAFEGAGHLMGDMVEDAEIEYIRMEAIRAVHEAIETLPPQSRQVIRMMFIEGKKLPEIAEQLNISYNTVQNHRQRGLELLRNHIIKNKVISTFGLMLALSYLESQ